MADAGGLQLLPTQKRSFNLGLSGGNGFFVVSLIMLAVVGILYAGVGYFRDRTISRVDDVHAQIQSIYETRDRTQEEKLINLKKQLATTLSILQMHSRWSEGLSNIDRFVLPRVVFISLTADADQKSYTFHATADSYATVAKQIAAFYATDLVTNVKLNKVSVLNEGGIDFSMQLTLK